MIGTRPGAHSQSVRRKTHPGTYLFFLAGFIVILFASHAWLLDLPFFWDELGQTIPASLDLHRSGAWIPFSTTPIIHPPGVNVYLAAVWSVFGYSIESTRAAMLLLSALAVLGVFLLAIEMCRNVPGAPALSPVLWLLASPIFYTQSMMALLEGPAALCTVFALLWFLQGHSILAVIACLGAVLSKETSAVLPVVLAAWAARDRRWSFALALAATTVPVFIWGAILGASTGRVLGNDIFTSYNFWFPLHPVRLLIACLRRISYIFLENFHWVGTVALVLAWRRTEIFRNKPWAIAASFAVVQTLAVTALGGATLERYLLPVLPLFYIAVAAALATFSRRARIMAATALFIGLVASLFFGPPFWPYPHENNLAMVDLIQTNAESAAYLETRSPAPVVATAWPLSDALRRPDFGYVHRGLQVERLPDFNQSSMSRVQRADTFVLYSRMIERPWGILKIPAIREIWERYYAFEPQIGPDDLRDTGFRLVYRAERRNQWTEIYTR
jgi:hypothetical protein